jgi:hypothetical protein
MNSRAAWITKTVTMMSKNKINEKRSSYVMRILAFTILYIHCATCSALSVALMMGEVDRNVTHPSTPKNTNFVVADIACLPAPENVKNQENFFSAIRKNKINFIL